MIGKISVGRIILSAGKFLGGLSIMSGIWGEYNEQTCNPVGGKTYERAFARYQQYSLRIANRSFYRSCAYLTDKFIFLLIISICFLRINNL